PDTNAEPQPEPPPTEPPPTEPPPPAWQPRPEDDVTPHLALQNVEALAPFYDRLAALDDDEPDAGVVRVVHLGSSMIGADDLPGVLRGRFQTRFGDGGAGLVLLQRYMPNYLHRWVKLTASGWQHCYIAYRCKKDGHYGLGGTTFWAKSGASTTIATRSDELGDEVSHFEVWYAATKGGGRLDVRVDRGETVQINTRAEKLEDRYHAIDVEPGPHKIRVRAVGYGRSRAYGVVLETDRGLVWDQFSMLGAFTRRMLEWDPEHIAGQIAQRNPDLIVFTYGGNDTRRAATGKLTSEQYIQEYTEAIARVRAGKPGVACLITGMTDRAKSLEFKITAKHVELIHAAQIIVAKQAGCAFFDSLEAMGGPGSAIRWRDMRPPLASPDLKHLNHRGRVKLGGWIYDAVIAGYVAYRKGQDPAKPTP
ncbi:MAG: hypothetical protein K0V04_41715, partial [Deltaproteobacteria bacterium]|nr:hypothetical protein [Deltaproteobacteria bacterium]